MMAKTYKRPLSPHLQVYRLPLTGIISISHRLTGVLLSFGLIAVVYILYSLQTGGSTYQDMQWVANFWVTKCFYWGFIYALFFHLTHGIRHLIWDIGKSFDKDTLSRYAIIELVISLLLTLSALFFI